MKTALHMQAYYLIYLKQMFLVSNLQLVEYTTLVTISKF